MAMLARGTAAVIFDLDGVVTDTAAVHAAAWKRLFDGFLEEQATVSGLPVPPFDIDTDYRRYVDGRPRYDGVRSFLASRGITLPEGDPNDPPEAVTVQAVGDRKNRIFLEALERTGARPFPSTVELVHALVGSGIRVAVISASRNAEAVLDAAGLANLFPVRVDGVTARELGLPGKPDPAMLLEAARRLGVTPGQAVVVEDAMAGVQAGRDGGFLQIVGVDRTGRPDLLRGSGADVVVTDLAEIELDGRAPAGRPIDRLPDVADHLGEVSGRAYDKRLAVFLDYDGTLTPIVDDPAAALLPEATRAAIRDLASVVPVAVVSGRDLADVRRLVDLEGLWYAGSHGFDIVGPDGARHERAPDTLPSLDDAEHELRPLLERIPGARLERKRYAVTAHFRGVADDRIDDVEMAVASVAAANPDLRVTGGKKVLELRPDVAWDKGLAIRWLLETQGLDAPDVLPIYVGDDETDEDGFRALGRGGIGIVVRGESDDRTTRALFALGRPDDVPDLLDRLAAIGGAIPGGCSAGVR